MNKFRIFTTAAVLSMSLLTMTGCGDRDTAMDNDTINRRNVSTNDVRIDRRDVSTNDLSRMSRNNISTNDQGMVGLNRNDVARNDESMTGSNLSDAIPARNAKGYITPSPVATTRLCPCPNQTTTPSTGTTTPNTGTTTPSTSVSGGALDATELRVVELTNAERRKNGLSDLKVDNSLGNVAQAKSNDMLARNYFSHTSPTYGSPFDMMRSFGVSYSYAGENIAKGQRSADEVVKAWMNSPGHRANILNRSFTHIGIGYTSNQNYWTQMFIGK